MSLRRPSVLLPAELDFEAETSHFLYLRSAVARDLQSALARENLHCFCFECDCIFRPSSSWYIVNLQILLFLALGAIAIVEVVLSLFFPEYDLL